MQTFIKVPFIGFSVRYSVNIYVFVCVCTVYAYTFVCLPYAYMTYTV